MLFKSVNGKCQVKLPSLGNLLIQLGSGLGLEYSDDVVVSFAKMVDSWEHSSGGITISLVPFLRKVIEVKTDEYNSGKLTKKELAGETTEVLKKIFFTVEEEFSSSDQPVFELTKVIQSREANCLGYAQLFHVLGEMLSIKIDTLAVTSPASEEIRIGRTHVSSMAHLPDNTRLMLDLRYPMFSDPFRLEDQFRDVDGHWEIKNASNPLKIHKRFQVVDRNGLVAMIYANRGAIYGMQRQYTEVLSNIIKAIELNPRSAYAHHAGGCYYGSMGQTNDAIAYYTKAIQLDKKLASSYFDRGKMHLTKKDFQQAISDFSKAIELKPDWEQAYEFLAGIYGESGQYDKSIHVCNKAIERNPESASMYLRRGALYLVTRNIEKSLKDLRIGVEKNPLLELQVKQLLITNGVDPSRL